MVINSDSIDKFNSDDKSRSSNLFCSVSSGLGFRLVLEALLDLPQSHGEVTIDIMINGTFIFTRW